MNRRGNGAEIIHAADLHLDSPLRGLEAYEGAPVEAIREAPRQAFRHLIDHCLERKADLLLIAGDVFDGDWRDFNTGLFLTSQLARLSQAGIGVVLLRGNHDAASVITAELVLPKGVHELPSTHPATIRFEELGVAVHGQSFPQKEVTEDLAAAYPDRIPGRINIGMLHTALEGRTEHARYAPTTPEVLAAKGYDYWALGHVHRREVVSERDPAIVFPGNLQGRHIRETGAKGATRARFEGGALEDLEHIPLDELRWARCRIDATEADEATLLERIRVELESALEGAGDRILAARVELEGTTSLHPDFLVNPDHWRYRIRGLGTELANRLWIEKVRFFTHSPTPLAALQERDDPVGGLLRRLQSLREDSEALQALAGELDGLRRRLPREATEGEEGLDLADPALLDALLQEVQEELLPRLLSEGGEG